MITLQLKSRYKKITIILAVVILTGCSNHSLSSDEKSQHQMIKRYASGQLPVMDTTFVHSNFDLHLELPDEIHATDTQIVLHLFVANRSSESFLISNPMYWVNSHPRIFHQDQEVQTPLVNFNFDKVLDFIELNSNDTIVTSFSDPLNWIITLHPTMKGQYQIYFKYTGIIRSKNSNDFKTMKVFKEMKGTVAPSF